MIRRRSWARTACTLSRMALPSNTASAKAMPRLVVVGVGTSWMTTAYPSRKSRWATADPTSPIPRTTTVNALEFTPQALAASGKPRISTALNLGTLALPRTGSARTTGFRRSSVGSPLEGLGHRAEDTPTPDPGLASQKRPHLLQELGEGRLSLEKQVVAARQGDKPGARDACRHAAPGLERDARLVARVHHQRRHAHL
jgi:hypothetical protein